MFWAKIDLDINTIPLKMGDGFFLGRFKMLHEIVLSDLQLTVDTTTRLNEVREKCPTFFTANPGERKTFVMHRGCVIVNCYEKDKRTISTFVYGHCFKTDQYHIVCISNDKVRTIAQSKHLIDKMLRKGFHLIEG
jgi:hypothetical protein